MEQQTDEEIARAVQTGNLDAFAQLVSRYEDKMQRYGRRFLASAEDIEDLVQEVFIKVYSNIQSFDATQRFSPWIYRIAHNIFVNELRRKSRHSYGIFDADTLLPFLAAPDTADEQALSAEQTQEWLGLVEQLSPKYREVIVLHYYEELSYIEMSDVLRIPVSTVGARMTRARAKLKELYLHTYE